MVTVVLRNIVVGVALLFINRVAIRMVANGGSGYRGKVAGSRQMIWMRQSVTILKVGPGHAQCFGILVH